jgi:hypothetical protein
MLERLWTELNCSKILIGHHKIDNLHDQDHQVRLEY